MIVIDIDLPQNCHECDALGISDVVGLKCPCEIDKTLYDFNGRPEKCPLKEQEDQPCVVRHAWFVAWRRIKDLADGIKDQCKSPSSNIEIVEEWAKEVQMQCEILKEFDLRKETKQYDVANYELL